jgi:hypothetical protein
MSHSYHGGVGKKQKHVVKYVLKRLLCIKKPNFVS